MVEEDNQWTLGDLTITLKMGSQSASTATSTDIWQRNAEQKRRNEKPGNVLSVTRKDILRKTAKESRQ